MYSPSLAFWNFLEAKVKSAASKPWRTAAHQQTGLQQSSAQWNAKHLFHMLKKKEKKEKKKPADFPPSPPLRALCKGVSRPPVHIQHSRGERRARGVMYWRNVVPQSGHSIKKKCEECAFARTQEITVHVFNMTCCQRLLCMANPQLLVKSLSGTIYHCFKMILDKWNTLA